MARDGSDPSTQDLEAAKRQALAAYRRIAFEWVQERDAAEFAKSQALAANAEVSAREARMAELSEAASRLGESCKWMGFDLGELLTKAQAAESIPEAPPPKTEAQLKDLVLEAVKRAYPDFRNADSIQYELQQQGLSFHPKTVGMSLYRWSKKGFVRREGKAKWFYVPEEQRKEPESIVGDIEELAEESA